MVRVKYTGSKCKLCDGPIVVNGHGAARLIADDEGVLRLVHAVCLIANQHTYGTIEAEV